MHLVLGFLGAGKTTFIKSVIRRNIRQHEKIVFIVNDFGNENYDAALFRETIPEVIEVNDGCLCCGHKNEFEQTLIECAGKNDIDRIIIEPSGLFIPENIIPSFYKEPLRSSMILEPVLVVADVAFLSRLTKPWPPFLSKHIEACDIIILNRHDQVPAGARKNVEGRLEKLNGEARIVTFEEGAEMFYKTNDLNQAASYRHEKIGIMGDSKHPFTIKHDNKDVFFKNRGDVTRLFESKPTNLVRAKGVIAIDGEKIFVNYTKNGVDFSDCPDGLDVGVTYFFEIS